jgi:hypothetical protein
MTHPHHLGMSLGGTLLGDVETRVIHFISVRLLSFIDNLLNYSYYDY